MRSWLEWRALALVAFAFPPVAAAQSVSLSASVVDANHYLLGSRLAGVTAGVSYPLYDGPVLLRFGVERVAGDSRRIGSTCAGLALPGTCQPEPVRDNAHVTSAGAGVGLRIVERHRLALNLTGDVNFAVLHVDSHGLASGRSISAGKELWDIDVGAEGAWSPWTRIPLAVEASLAAGHMVPVTNELVLDGYTPFEQSFDLVRARIGLAWRFSSTRR